MREKKKSWCLCQRTGKVWKDVRNGCYVCMTCGIVNKEQIYTNEEGGVEGNTEGRKTEGRKTEGRKTEGRGELTREKLIAKEMCIFKGGNKRYIEYYEEAKRCSDVELSAKVAAAGIMVRNKWMNLKEIKGISKGAMNKALASFDRQGL